MEGSAKKRRICEYDGTTTSPSCSHGMATSSGYDYEVFLSFKGADTRSGFTDFLYTSLDNAGIRTFKDDEELRVGEEFAPKLLQAINQSKISIPIFSKGYASSVWCLKEVAQMVERQKTGKQKILPIFYDVAPSEVRHQTGGYGEAFRSHKNKKRHDEETMQEWKNALNVVGAINGWNLHSMSNRREGEFAKELTEEVYKELKKAYLVISDYLVGVDNHVDAIMEMIGARTSETRIIGIHGMGGIGKTTIAKMIYNRLSHNIENCCFLHDIRETSKGKGIQFLQNQLIFDILKIKCMDIKDTNEGTQTIKDMLSNKRVLLLLDDVEEENHTNALVGKRDWLGKGSKIIITTRNKGILDIPEVDHSYELSIMDPVRSLQLFSKYAFGRDSPLEDYIEQSNRAICIAGGLPLALEVIGSLLCRTKKEMWDATLKMLERVPHDKVQSKLKISYDALDFRQKLIFLDIACLFIGYDKDILVHFWDESYFFPKVTMKVLQNMSLIKINEDNKVLMHDQLRDLGREIVRQKSDMRMEKQSRVWDLKEGLDLLMRYKGNKKVEALRLKLDHEWQHCITYDNFKTLSNLRFLEVGGSKEHFRVEERLLWGELPSNVLPTNDFLQNSDLLPQLRWLSWHDILPTFKITAFSMKDVVILDLSESTITHNWKGWSHIKVMRNLKVLNLARCLHLERTPVFSPCSNLERLILESCILLREIDTSICHLKSLVFLDVSYCENLQSLPDELGRDLARLEYLSLNYCKLLVRLPDSIGNLESLIELDMSYTSIKELPQSIGNLKNLKVVKMWDSEISEIPEALWTIGKLEEIEGLNSFGIHVRIGNCIYENQSLRILRLVGARIHALPRLPESLVTLDLHSLYMDRLPDLSNLANLKELHLSFGPPPDYGWKSDGLVEYPILDSEHVTTSPTDLTLPPQLKKLDLKCPNLRRLPRLPSRLSFLNLHECYSLCWMEDLSNLKNLSSLRISHAAIAEVRGLDCLENLRHVELWYLGQLEILPDLSNLNKLSRLRVAACHELVEIQGELPQSLEELEIIYCGSLQKVPNMSSSMRLRKVEVNHCRELNVEEISSLCSEKSIEFVGEV
ncbi:disease resistance protein RUN1-like [Rhodamnia argentea]|uniref:Disease resistance protein RUN1-like n=1 Tax=Rhodamnia argentea TaxID=178133 RepID=A0ABM3GXW4_9MYRT|nr:disease resistance protein RUN1-like [Rhodamnia argentea]